MNSWGAQVLCVFAFQRHPIPLLGKGWATPSQQPVAFMSWGGFLGDPGGDGRQHPGDNKRYTTQ